MTSHPAALLVLAAALLLWSPTARLAGLRARGLRTPAEEAGTGSGDPPVQRRRWLFAAGAGLAAGLLVGGVLGAGAAVVIAVVADRLLRGGDPEGNERAALSRELPGACDLLGVCLSAGVPVGAALAAVGAAVPDPLSRHLTAVSALGRLGAEPRRAWAGVPAELGPLGRVLVRAGESGAAAAPALQALAADARASERAATEAAVRRAGVWVLAPLGLCFLPAFVCLGVVPMVLGLAGELLG
ncbi:type II secretion system F family protein [Blastococcus tunisiensis]|uniref:Type II secretion system (T2SS), protein F n=1 Tax=Blastococcus tunisiensis TaxID=1798228 RepID=A0A1I1XSL7_9ACTN|nr:type II secretion system F family protein [Blastococcus sp. DSM 46838]SFE10312.1 Type II secretion system (T2SS), protein F [Blastococcus sp. DSM 46838]